MQELLHLHFACGGDDVAELLRDFAAGLRVEGTGRAVRVVGDAPEWFRMEAVAQPWGAAVHVSGAYAPFLERLIAALTERYGQVVIEER